MPRKTKESTEKLNVIKESGSNIKKVTEKKETKAKKLTKLAKEKIAAATKKNSRATKKEITEASLKAELKKKDETTPKTSAAKASVAKKSAKSLTSTTSTKKSAVTSGTKRNTQLKQSEPKTPIIKKKKYSPEYYDLPFKYNKTVVKILAQTPTNLFVYWEISDKDREDLKKQYGEYFFEITKPVLVVRNITKSYAFEIDIDDFANCWYIKVNDSNCEYKVELGRRPIPINYNYIPQYDIEKDGPIKPVENEYIFISTSNELESPNDHVLFNLENKVYFRNVKTNKLIKKEISEFPFIISNTEFTNVYDIYKYLFKEDFNKDRLIVLRNPSSGNGIPKLSEFLSSR